MKYWLAATVAILLLAGVIWPSAAIGSSEPRVAERVGTAVTIDQLPDVVEELVRAEVGEDGTDVILHVSTDDGDRYEITWKATGATIRTAFSPEGIVLSREVKVLGEPAADEEDDEDADGAEEQEEFERTITIDLVPEPAKATILKEAAGHELQEVEMIVVGGQLLYDADWHVDGFEVGVGVTPDGEVVDREREKIEDNPDE